MVVLALPIDEAEAVLKRLAESVSMTAEECRHVENFRLRLGNGIGVERGSCGSDDRGMEEIAKALVGQRVRVCTLAGEVCTGRLERLTGFRTLMLRETAFNMPRPINLSLVESLEAERAAA